MSALPLAEKLHTSSNQQVKFKAIAAEFGDGYSQRAPDGLNNKRQSFEITWPGLSLVDKDTVVAVLDSVGSWDVLTWQPPTEPTELKFIIDPESGYSIDYVATRFNISCRITQAFDL